MPPKTAKRGKKPAKSSTKATKPGEDDLMEAANNVENTEEKSSSVAVSKVGAEDETAQNEDVAGDVASKNNAPEDDGAKETTKESKPRAAKTRGRPKKQPTAEPVRRNPARGKTINKNLIDNEDDSVEADEDSKDRNVKEADEETKDEKENGVVDEPEASGDAKQKKDGTKTKRNAGKTKSSNSDNKAAASATTDQSDETNKAASQMNETYILHEGKPTNEDTAQSNEAEMANAEDDADKEAEQRETKSKRKPAKGRVVKSKAPTSKETEDSKEGEAENGKRRKKGGRVAVEHW